MRRLIPFLLLLSCVPASATTTVYLKQPLNSWNSAYGYANTTRSVLASTNAIVNTAASGTNIQMTCTAGGSICKWITPQLSAGVTISGTVTCNLRAKESSLSANAAMRCKVAKYTGGVEGAAFFDVSDATELTTSDAAQSISGTPTSTTFAAGDRIVLLPYITNAGGTMGNAFTVTMSYGGKTAAAAGDTFVTFTEAISFQAEPEFIQAQRSTGGGAAGTTASAFGGNSATGDTLKVDVYWNGVGITVTGCADGGDTFTAVTTATTWNTLNFMQVFVAKNVTGRTTPTITCTFSGTTTNLSDNSIQDYSGVDTTTPVDVFVFNAGTSGTTLDSTSVSTNAAYDMLVGTGESLGGSATAGTGYTQRDLSWGTTIEDQSILATGSHSATATGGTCPCVMGMVALKGAFQPAAGTMVKRKAAF